MRIHRGRRCERGISLVEVMVSMVLLMIGLLAVVTQWPHGARMVVKSEFETEATLMAEQYLEMLNASPFPPSSGSRVMGRYTVAWTVSPGPHAQTRLATVSVTWNWQGRLHRVRMSTVLAAEL